MSPVFRHGRLRLYLLKLLDEAPRHGYEVIRLLQDRFLGVYAPSPGTIYPRLARLEEEGLVTHDEVDGRKVYRITGKGREELRSRLDDLTELEETITASVRDIAREVTEDVRETVRSLREELASAARDIHGRARQAGGEAGTSTGDAAGDGEGSRRAGDEAHRRRDEAYRAAGEAHRAAGETHRPAGETHRAAGETHRAKGEAHQARDEARRTRREEASETRAGTDWGEWAGWGGWYAGRDPAGCADPRSFRDMERLARRFTRELRNAAWQAQAVSEDAVHELRTILDETIDRIRTEVFRGKSPQAPSSGPGDETGARQGDTAAEAGGDPR